MKYVQPLTEAERITLTELMKNNNHARARMRAHAILLSERRFTVNQMMNIYQDRARYGFPLAGTVGDPATI